MTSVHEATGLEDRVARLVEDTTGMGQVPFDESLFALGLSSIGAAVLNVGLSEAFGVELPDDFVYVNPTVRTMARALAAVPDVAPAPATPAAPAPALASTDLAATLARNGEVFGETAELFPAYFLQRWYLHDGYSSNITVELSFAKQPGVADRCSQAIGKLIEGSELLRSRLVQTEDGLSFQVAPAGVQWEIARVGATDAELQDRSFVESLRSKLSTTLGKVRTDQPLHQPLLVESDHHLLCVWTFSHAIFDQASAHVVKRFVAEEVAGMEPVYPAHSSYAEYARWMTAYNTIDRIEAHPLTLRLASAKTPEFTFPDEPRPLLLSCPVEDSSDPEAVTRTLIHRVGTLLAEVAQVDRIAVSTILNIREVGGMDNRGLVGDYHSNVTFPVDRGQSSSSLLAEQRAVLADYRDGLQPLVAVFGTYPEMSERQRRLDDLYNIRPVTKLNYLGELQSQRLSDVLAGLQGVWASLAAFRGSRIYATAFSMAGTAYVAFPRFPVTSHQVVEGAGLSVVTLDEPDQLPHTELR